MPAAGGPGGRWPPPVHGPVAAAGLALLLTNLQLSSSMIPPAKLLVPCSSCSSHFHGACATSVKFKFAPRIMNVQDRHLDTRVHPCDCVTMSCQRRVVARHPLGGMCRLHVSAAGQKQTCSRMARVTFRPGRLIPTLGRMAISVSSTRQSEAENVSTAVQHLQCGGT